MSTTTPVGASAPAPPASGRAFSRSASGLIRVAGSWDVFIFNVGLVSVGIAIAFNQYYGPSLYPGALPWASTLLAALGMVAAATTFYFWSVIFPRSGGVYVSLSRSTNSALAFVFTVVESMILLYYGALAASLIVKVGLSSFFATVGTIGGSHTLLNWAAWLTKPVGTFWIGAALLVLAGVVLTTGTRRYFTVQKALFAVAVVGMLVVAIVMLVGSRSSFNSHLHHLTGLTTAGVIASAKAKGFVTGHADFWKTVKFMVWPLLPLLGAIQSVGIGGEIKRVGRNQLVGMLGAVAATGVLIALFALLANKAFGSTFQGAIAFNSVSGNLKGSTEAATGASPYFTVLAGILANNVVLAVIIMATFVAWIWFWIPAEIAYTTRTMIAWSFDRLAPDRLGYVSKRFNTPVVAIWISTGIAIVFMWAIAYKHISLLTLVEPLLVIWGAAMLIAVFFPITGKRFFQASPASAFKLGRIPLMSITGALTVAFFGLAIVLLWKDKIAAGPLIAHHLPTDFWILVSTLGAGILWYIGNRVYRSRQGIDIDLAFKQIPIE
jgi:APA family basic amino acid/polyamine antiporter